MVIFYTGFENIDAFNTLFGIVIPIVRKRWSGYEKSFKK